jgi:hypothetical protein
MRKTYRIKVTPEVAREAEEAHRRQVRVRLDPDLLGRLVQESDRHRRTFNAEIRLRLEASFEQDARRRLEDICADMHVAWGRFAARFLRVELADELADAVLQGGDSARIHTLARLIVEQRNIERRGLGGVS